MSFECHADDSSKPKSLSSTLSPYARPFVSFRFGNSSFIKVGNKMYCDDVNNDVMNINEEEDEEVKQRTTKTTTVTNSTVATAVTTAELTTPRRKTISKRKMKQLYYGVYDDDYEDTDGFSILDEEPSINEEDNKKKDFMNDNVHDIASTTNTTWDDVYVLRKDHGCRVNVPQNSSFADSVAAHVTSGISESRSSANLPISSLMQSSSPPLIDHQTCSIIELLYTLNMYNIEIQFNVVNCDYDKSDGERRTYQVMLMIHHNGNEIDQKITAQSLHNEDDALRLAFGKLVAQNNENGNIVGNIKFQSLPTSTPTSMLTKFFNETQPKFSTSAYNNATTTTTSVAQSPSPVASLSSTLPLKNVAPVATATFDKPKSSTDMNSKMDNSLLESRVKILRTFKLIRDKRSSISSLLREMIAILKKDNLIEVKFKEDKSSQMMTFIYLSKMRAFPSSTYPIDASSSIRENAFKFAAKNCIEYLCLLMKFLTKFSQLHRYYSTISSSSPEVEIVRKLKHLFPKIIIITVTSKRLQLICVESLGVSVLSPPINPNVNSSDLDNYRNGKMLNGLCCKIFCDNLLKFVNHLSLTDNDYDNYHVDAGSDNGGVALNDTNTSLPLTSSQHLPLPPPTTTAQLSPILPEFSLDLLNLYPSLKTWYKLIHNYCSESELKNYSLFELLSKLFEFDQTSIQSMLIKENDIEAPTRVIDSNIGVQIKANKAKPNSLWHTSIFIKLTSDNDGNNICTNQIIGVSAHDVETCIYKAIWAFIKILKKVLLCLNNFDLVTKGGTRQNITATQIIAELMSENDLVTFKTGQISGTFTIIIKGVGEFNSNNNNGDVDKSKRDASERCIQFLLPLAAYTFVLRQQIKL